ncbi:MAG: carbamate kinase [Spirochaetales bacterium]|nr:carbamate kinase [Spirochaetales bacterium]
MPEKLVIAVGGNALIEDPHHVSVHAQYLAARHAAESLGGLAAEGHKLAIVHGNGPQVGFILRRAELARGVLHEVPLDSCVADTQGALGYNLQMALTNEMKARGANRSAATVVTQVLVDPEDEAFANPVKPIGGFMEEAEAKKRSEEEGWKVREDAGRGWRRVVPSPEPSGIVELEVVRALVDSGVITVAAGGGGIPVAPGQDGELEGVEAVIDKDKAASLLAQSLDADKLVISTAVPRVCINFGQPNQKELETVSVAEAQQLIEEGHFAPGSMLPKVQAIVAFVQATGKEGVITDPPHLKAALAGRAGTRFIP